MDFGDIRLGEVCHRGAKIVPERIKEARIYRGLTQKDLALGIGVTKQSICNYEKGSNFPTIDALLKMSTVLSFPLEFFYKARILQREQGEVYFRSSAIPAKKKEMLEQRLDYLSNEIVGFAEKYIKFPSIDLIDVPYKAEYSKGDIVEIVMRLRDHWGLGLRPIKNLMYSMQEHGCVVAKLNLNSDKTDGFSKWEGNRPYTFINTEKNAAVRARFTLAHELGHIVLHRNVKEDLKKREMEANFFAGEFLFPSDSVLNEVAFTTLDSLLALKAKWGVSVGVLVRRCLDLELITDDRYTMLQKQISKRRWRTFEPLDDVIVPEEPRLFKEAFDLLDKENIIKKADIPGLIAFDPDELIEICSLPREYFSEPKFDMKAKLRLVK